MIRTYEAGVGIMIMLVALLQFVMLSAGRLGEQWDSTELDVEVKKALEVFQTVGVSDALKRYSKIRDPDLLRMPQSESVGYRLLINGRPSDKTVPPAGVEVAAADARIYHESRDAARLVRSLRTRLLRSAYVQMAGRTMDHDSVDELADIILGLLWDEESDDIVKERVSTLIDNQNDDGGWGFVRDEESDALCTGMAIRALSAWVGKKGGDPLSNSTVTDGISWLKDRVHADGGYGSRERIESSVDMTAHALLAFTEAGLGTTDSWTAGARDYLLRLQSPDGGFPINRRSTSDMASTAVATEALMAVGASQSVIEKALNYLETRMISDGNFTFALTPIGGAGTYDLTIGSGYIVDCSPRGHEFWGSTSDDSIVNVLDVYGDDSNMTVVLQIERGRLEPPTNKQKIALAVSHNMTPDTDDLWIVSAGNPHTSGEGKQIDSPQFDQVVSGRFTILTITNLQVPAGYEILNGSCEDWLIALVGDGPHPIKDNPGRGYLIGYWGLWMKLFPFNDILAWRAWSPRVNRVCLDADRDWEFDDKRLAEGDTLTYEGRDWELGIEQIGDDVNLSFHQADLNTTRYYWPLKYNLSTIPESQSGLYHFGMISVQNKPSFSRNYKVILRDSVEEDTYDEAYIWNGTQWNFFPDGSTWNESGTLWVIGVEGDFLTLTRSTPVVLSGISGQNVTSRMVEGDFVEVEVARQGPKEVWLTLYYESEEMDRGVFATGLPASTRQVFGVWGSLRETSKVYHALTLAESWLTGPSSSKVVHDTADLCQQAIKFNKVYNSVIEDKLSVEAWYKSQGGGG